MTTYFPSLAGVRAFSTHAGFNICHYAGADPDQVAADLRRLRQLTGAAIRFPRQVHGTRVATLTDAPADLEGVDALVTATPGQLLCISTADCLPLLLVDPVARVIGAAHCGWRGTVAGIAPKTVEAMTALGATPANIHAAMGPCICPACFEVGEEVAAQFPAEAVIRQGYPKPHVSLEKAVALQLHAAGVRTIAYPTACSKESADLYSVRRQGPTLPFRTLTAILLV